MAPESRKTISALDFVEDAGRRSLGSDGIIPTAQLDARINALKQELSTNEDFMNKLQNNGFTLFPTPGVDQKPVFEDTKQFISLGVKDGSFVTQSLAGENPLEKKALSQAKKVGSNYANKGVSSVIEKTVPGLGGKYLAKRAEPVITNFAGKVIDTAYQRVKCFGNACMLVEKNPAQ